MFFGSNFYYLILGLQGFALFHAYKSNTFQKWYFIIIFIPVIGSLIYLYDAFYSRRNIEGIGEGVMRLVNPDYDVKKLEREVEIADTISNKLNLANAYINSGQNEKALTLYEDCMKGTYANDPDLFMKKLKACYLLNKYNDTIEIGEKLSKHRPFDQSEEKILFAQAYACTDQPEKAEEVFQSMNHKNCNYTHRIALAHFLLGINKISEAKDLVLLLENESKLMDGFEKRNNRLVIKEISKMKQRFS
jgi:hypothetical protein